MLRTADFVRAGLYDNEESVIRDGLRYLLQARPELRLELGIYRYRTEDISLIKAANLAGVSFEQMKEILKSRSIEPRLGLETREEALEEVANLRRHLHGQGDQ
jgi:predicted HTH domain antitoxin